MAYQQQHVKKIAPIVVKSLLLVGLMVSGVMYVNSYSNLYHLQTASATKDKNIPASGSISSSSSATTNTIQLSAKEVKSGIYNWIDVRNGAPNPTLKVFANTQNIIKIQNPTDTKHELIVDTAADVLPSSDDINPNSSGQLSFSPTTAGTFTYHCAYHPFTMKGTIQIVSSSGSKQ
jgi:Cupredoxin-like domain